jgi:hypothetical protein
MACCLAGRMWRGLWKGSAWQACEGCSFLKKRTKKLLPIWRARCGWRGVKWTKVFCFFSSEKKYFLRFSRI